ncbi:MAG: hypothetical protein HKN93_05905 [Acidimicrobiia bacterium]|nr:hypothetical protein [Acidimicrobiia bacterium]
MSVGHVGRAIEEAGIATTAVYVRSFRHVVDEMQLPRAVITNHPMGRPLGAAHDRDRQRAVVNAALGLIDTAAERTIVDDPTPFRPTSS